MFTKQCVESVKRIWLHSWLEAKAGLRAYLFMVLVLFSLLITTYLGIYIYLIFKPEERLLSIIYSQGLISYWGFLIATIICATNYKTGKIYRKFCTQFHSNYIWLFINVSIFSLLIMFLLTGMKDSIEIVTFVMLVGVSFSYGNLSYNET